MSGAETTTPISRAKYSGRDFDTIWDDLRQFLKDRYPDTYSDFQSSSQGVMLMDMLAHSLMQMHWYLDRRASEAYLDTARRTSSASRLTRQNGYKMRPAASSSVDLTVTPDAAKSFAFPIRVGFKFAGPNGLVFEATEEVQWSALSVAPKTINAREGETHRRSSAADGSARYEVKLIAAGQEGVFLQDGSTVVYVDGVLWEEVDFIEFGEGNQYEVHYHEEPPLIRFGNGVAGTIPPVGADIRVTYVVQHGEAGNVGSGSISDVSTPLVYRNETIALTVTNSVASSGGSNPETVEEARRNAPAYYGARKRAVTQSDYQALAGTYSHPEYGAVAAANAFVAREYTEDIESVGYINAVEGEVENYQAALTAFVASGAALVSGVTSDLSAIAAREATISTETTSVLASLTAILAAANTLNAGSPQLAVVLETVNRMLANDGGWAYDIDELIADTVGIPSVALDLTDNWKPAIQELLAIITGVKSSVDANAPTCRDQALSADAQVDLVVSDMSVITSSRTDAQADVASLSATLDGIGSEVASHEATIDGELQDLKDHLSVVFGSDCDANLITVPVLAYDGDGNYQAPSTGLRNELEMYLQGIADVAHLVNVVDGSADIILVDVTVNLKQADAYVFSEVSSSIKVAITAEMKKRAFGSSLYLNKVYRLSESVTGVEDFDLSLSADSDYEDDAGNIICPAGKVLALGTLTISPLAD